jgi:hypothetical protein
MNDAVVPAGAIAAVSSVDCDKMGRYAFEVSDEELASAKIVALDLHWALALPSVEAISKRVRELNPRASVVIGGISAGLWAERLISGGIADHVIQGDAEPGFPSLVAAIVSGGEPPVLPNVWSKGRPPPEIRRASVEAHDASRSAVAPWFPTYERLQAIGARGLSHDRTVVVVRGCALSCPGCHGSFAGSFGPGTLARSPASLLREVRDAEACGTRHLVLVYGRANPALLRASARALADAGPFRIREHVGIFCCQPPDDETLTALMRAFECRIGLSVLDPLEQVPAPSPERAEQELARWREVATRVELVLWTSELARVERLRDGFSGRVSWTGAWDVTRPTFGAGGSDFDSVREAVAPFWTFAAVRALSPTLARILSPFGWLDELEAEPTLPAQLHPRVAALGHEAFERWRLHRLPCFPSLSFGALADGTMLPLEMGRDARGPRLSARGLQGRRFAVVPRSPGDEREWLTLLERDGLSWLELPEPAQGVELEVRLAFDAAVIEAREPSGRSLGCRVVDGGLYAGGHPLVDSVPAGQAGATGGN